MNCMRMEIIGCTRSVAVLTLIFLSPIYFSSAQPGFLSIDCGGKGSRRDNETGITWIPDDGYIQGGRKEEHNDSDLQFYHQSLRVFPKPLRKSCYRLPITPNVPFLLRLYFVGRNYTNKIPDFRYSIETQDMLTLRKATNQTESLPMSEKILMSHGEVLYICLIRTSDYVDPFISSIEMRSLRQGMYNPVQSGLMLNFRLRHYLGSNPSVVRYPVDQFDRFWYPLSVNGTENLTSVVPISTNNTKDLPPTVIMQTAVAGRRKDRLDVFLNEPTKQTLLLLYFADIRNSPSSIPFDILTNNEKRITNVQLNRNLSAMELSLITDNVISSFTVKTPINTAGGVLLNAFECYQRIYTSSRTVLQDVQALKAVKARFNLRNWVSDPCFTIAWDGILCNNSTSNVRVSEIDLSGRNLNGTIPSSLANMTALINMYVQNFSFTFKRYAAMSYAEQELKTSRELTFCKKHCYKVNMEVNGCIVKKY